MATGHSVGDLLRYHSHPPPKKKSSLFAFKEGIHVLLLGRALGLVVIAFAVFDGFDVLNLRDPRQLHKSLSKRQSRTKVETGKGR